MAKKSNEDSYSKKEARQRFEAALLGARVTGHKPKAGKKKRGVGTQIAPKKKI